MNEPKWLLESAIHAMHDRQLAEHGGASGTRDHGMLESALARPRNQYAYGVDDLHALAAAYAVGIAKNHPYVDGNKRTAFLAAFVFLRINGLELIASEADATQAMLGVASGDVTEDRFAEWLRANTRAL